jgi:hypothetical protein
VCAETKDEACLEIRVNDTDLAGHKKVAISMLPYCRNICCQADAFEVQVQVQAKVQVTRRDWEARVLLDRRDRNGKPRRTEKVLLCQPLDSLPAFKPIQSLLE